MEKIFISYRRSDSASITDRIYRVLSASFGDNNVFKDVDDITIGTDFRAAIERALINCNIMLVIVGPNWLNAVDERGERRLNNPQDFVRMEVEMGLRHRNVMVIPVLVNGANMPDPNQLPPGLYNLAYANAATVRPDPDLDRDLQRLVVELRKMISSGMPGARRRSFLMIVVAVAAVVVLAYIVISSQPKELSSRNMTETASALEVIFTLSPVPSLTLTPAASSTVTASPTPIPSETPIATLTDNPEVAQPWAIIFSNDSSLEEAQFEANRAIRLGYTDTVIYKTTSWYVTVIRHFASRDEALASLQSDSVMKTNRPNAYVDDLDRLCPVQVSRAQYVECAAS